MKKLIVIILIALSGFGIYYLFNNNDNSTKGNDTEFDGVNERQLFDETEDLYTFLLKTANQDNSSPALFYESDIKVEDLSDVTKAYYTLYYAEEEFNYTANDMALSECLNADDYTVVKDFQKCGYRSLSLDKYENIYKELFNEEAKDFKTVYLDSLSPCYYEDKEVQCYLLLGGITNDFYYTSNLITDIRYEDGKVYLYEDVIHFAYLNLDDMYVLEDVTDVNSAVLDTTVFDGNNLYEKLYNNDLTIEDNKLIHLYYDGKYVTKYVHIFEVIDEEVYWIETNKN